MRTIKIAARVRQQPERLRANLAVVGQRKRMS